MNSRYLASLSLAVMACGFILTLFLPENVYTFLLKGGFEAGLVGGIADWFAVTALFRHPLGIPIPHTSLLLKNKDRIVQSLVSAMENELLNKQSIESKLKKWNVFRAVFSMLTRLMSRKKTRSSIANLAIGVVHRLPLEKAVPLIRSGIAAFVRRADLKQAADTVITKVVTDGYDAKALDYALREASAWAVRPDTQVMLGKIVNEKVNEVKMGGFMGFAIQAFAGFMDEEKMGVILQNMLLSAIHDLQDADNAHRETLLREIRVQLFQMAGDDSRLDQLKDWVIKFMEGQAGEQFIQERLEDFRNLLLDKLEEERAGGGRQIFAAYAAIVRNLSQDREMVEVWENRVSSYITQLVESNHYRIGQLVKENVDRMDDASLIGMLEDKVGKDLQWIRVNGALCGFIVGIVLTLFQL
jgi:uncharacterized membrane-anchored protein YjiN (DUF445 family)